MDKILWGKDHWSLLGYMEVRCVDHKGVPDLRHMRVNDKKRAITNGAASLGMSWLETWGTRDKDGNIPDGGSDDFDVLDDLEAEGLLKNEFTIINPIITLTEKGTAIAHKLREHKASGGTFSNFKTDLL